MKQLIFPKDTRNVVVLSIFSSVDSLLIYVHYRVVLVIFSIEAVRYWL